MASEHIFISITDRIKGAIFGVCVCDALGGPVQFKERGTFRPVDGLRFVAPFDMPAGAWSDDGSMTLCLAQSLIDQRGQFSKLDTADKFVKWRYKGYYSSIDRAWDVGVSTTRALTFWYSRLSKGLNDVAEIQQRVDQALKHENCSGNGSLMRTVPVGIAMFRDPVAATKAARDQSDITHPYPICADACEIYTKLIVAIMNGERDKETLARSIDANAIAESILRERLQRYRTLGDWKSKAESEVKTSGWVVDTLEASLWAFFNTDDFRSGALRIVNFGDDSDTVGAVFGGLAGAYYGLEAVPRQWRVGLLKNELVEKVAADLAAMVEA